MTGLEDYPLSLALEDFVPVVLTAVGMWFIVRFVAQRSPSDRALATTGAVFVVAGGASKATWKLIAAIDGADVTVLDRALFPLLTIGFGCLAVAMWRADGQKW